VSSNTLAAQTQQWSYQLLKKKKKRASVPSLRAPS
jgi:hypothetical protein